MSASHADRAHAAWSASASARLWGCPGSLALIASLNVPDKESEAAAWGTAAHEVAEWTLNNPNVDCSDFPKATVKTKSHEIEVDDEVTECAQEFVNYVRGRLADHGSGATLLIEQRFDLKDLEPPFDAGGTGDAVLLLPKWDMIEIVDLKGGRGVVVEATNNKQLRTYALGAYMANPGTWKKVRATIVQPRAAHKDGRIRSEEIHVSDLIEWTAELMEAMQVAAKAERALTVDPLEGPVTWDQAFLRAGEHCTFCPAIPACPAVEKRAMALAETMFEPEGVKPPPAPETLGLERIAQILDAADMIQNWLNACRAYAQDQAEAGATVPGYVLVEKIGRRNWAKDDAEIAAALLKEAKLDTDEIYAEPKLKSPAQIEKVLGKKRKDEIKHLWETKVTGLNLARADKTTRSAVVAPALTMFNKED
jgi:hypothetical protein